MGLNTLFSMPLTTFLKTVFPAINCILNRTVSWYHVKNTYTDQTDNTNGISRLTVNKWRQIFLWECSFPQFTQLDGRMICRCNLYCSALMRSHSLTSGFDRTSDLTPLAHHFSSVYMCFVSLTVYACAVTKIECTHRIYQSAWMFLFRRRITAVLVLSHFSWFVCLSICSHI